jgi:membrane associated rhomboid family serine protease
VTDHDPYSRPPLHPEPAAAPVRPDRWETHPPLGGEPDPDPRPLPPAPPAPFTVALEIIIGVVAAFQVMVFLGLGRGAPIWAAADGRTAYVDAAALDPFRVQGGAWWLLLTCALMHGGLVHLLFNFSALRTLGRAMEWRGPRGWVPVVFLLSSLASSVASLLIPPVTLSVGASGGLMGMFGFLLVMAHRRKQHMPPGFLRALLINVALIAGMGVVLYQYVDNAAHLGGIIAGAAIGFFVIPDGAQRWDPRGGPVLNQAGIAALTVLAIAAVVAILAMLGIAFLP